MLNETGDASAAESSDVATQNSGSFPDKSITWSDFVLSENKDLYIGH